MKPTHLIFVAAIAFGIFAVLVIYQSDASHEDRVKWCYKQNGFARFDRLNRYDGCLTKGE